MNGSEYVIGADIGGTHCTAALINTAQRLIVRSSLKRTAVDAGANAKDIIAAWTGCILSAKENHPITGICLAMPGPFDYKQGISLMQGQKKYEQLYGLNIKELLADSLYTKSSDIFFDNDAACFLQGEVFAGSAVDHARDTVIGITLGTGLGTAIYRNGKTESANLWNLPFRNGIAEDWISSNWFLQRYRKETGVTIENVKALAMLAEADAVAQVIFLEFGEQLGEFLLEFVQQEDPKAIVIGGNISKAHALFGDTTVNLVQKKHPAIKIKWSALGEEAPLLGAAGSWLAGRQHDLVSAHPHTTF